MHFTGKERDSESGLDNFGARYNSSQYGRFMTPDPLQPSQWHPMLLDQFVADPQNWNKYVYSLDNPVTYADVGGHFTGHDHQRIEIAALTARGFSKQAASIAANADVRMDNPGNMSSGVRGLEGLTSLPYQKQFNPQHGERAEHFQTVEQAKAVAANFISTTVASAAEKALQGDVNGALEDIGKASHTAQDIVRHKFEIPAQHGWNERAATDSELKDAQAATTKDVLDQFVIGVYNLGMSEGLGMDQILQDISSVMQGPLQVQQREDDSNDRLGEPTCLTGIRCNDPLD